MTFSRPRPLVDIGLVQPIKHVIDEYRHRAEQVRCACGWQGSSASRMGAPSQWTLHVRQHKDAGR